MKKAGVFGSLALAALGGALLVGITRAQTTQATPTVVVGGYGGNIDPPLVNELIARFVRPRVPGVNVRYVPIGDPYTANLTNQLAAGTAPDVFYLPDSGAAALIATGRILPLSGLVASAPFLPRLQQPYIVGGRTYGIAKDFNTLAVFYNRDLFDDARVPYPDAQDTWVTFEDKLARVRRALGADYTGLCTPAEYARFGAFAAATGWRPFDARGRTNLSDARFVRAFTFYTGLEGRGVGAQPAALAADWGGACFRGGRVAVALEGGWLIPFLRDQAPNLQYGAVPLPRDPSTNRSGNLLFSVAWSINANTRHRDAAVRVLNALTSREAQEFILERGLALPSRSALADSPALRRDTPEARANRVIFQNANDPNVNLLPFTARTFGDDWFRPIGEALKAVMDGQSSVQAALGRAQTALDRLGR